MRRLSLRASRRCFSVSSRPCINLIQIYDGTFYREHPSSLTSSSSSNPPLFPNLTFELPATPRIDVGKASRKKDHWAVISSSDTSTFLNILRGDLLCTPPNARTYPYLAADEIAAKDPRLRIPSNAIQYVGFNSGNRSRSGGAGGIQGAYLSARYESRREETDWTVLQHLRGETELNPSEQLSNTVTDLDLLDRVIRDLRLGKLLDMPVSNLSNGQTRRCRIAKALLNRPECLLLDEPFMGLDPPTLITLSPMLRDLAYRSDPLLILGLRPQDPVPDWITDLIVLGSDHSVGITGKKEAVLDALVRWNTSWQRKTPAGGVEKELDESVRRLHERIGQPWTGVGDTLTEAGIVPFNLQLEEDNGPYEASSSTSSTTSSLKKLGDPLIELQSITLSYGSKVVLGHKTNSNPQGGLDLTISQGTRLALVGPNGSGKTTLLSLLTSDHPQSYSLPIKFFGRTRLPEKGKPGLSLWEIQDRIGHSSPEVHAFYPKGHSIRRVLESAWAETYSARPRLDADATARVDRFLRFWTPELRQGHHQQQSSTASNVSPASPLPQATETDDLTWASDKETHRMNILPFGTQRLLLFLRAIIKSPSIIILDEAFSGLNSTTRDKAMSFLEHGETTTSFPASASTYPSHSHPTPDPSDTTSSQPFTGLSDRQALIVVSHVREEVPRCIDEWVRLPSEDEATEFDRDILTGRVDTLAGGRGLRSSEGWAEVWGL